MVSVFDGQLTRTWFFPHKGRNHIISLYHDTITGVRSAAVDHIEIPGSSGYSSLFMESKGHRIFFTVNDLPGYIEIKRAGWTGFVYGCVVNDKKLRESTESISSNQDPVYRPKITETTLTPDENSEYPVTWYVVKTTRITDNVVTSVHRRFRDFSELNSQVKQNLKGNHLREIIPPLPEKPLKSMTDHRDPVFIQDRQAKLEIYLTALVAIPHVSDMICVKGFLGLMEQVREYSISFHVPTLGLSLVPADKTQIEREGVPVIVGSVQKPEVGPILPGDSISKINGIPISALNFNGVTNRIKVLPRPIIIHFIQVIGGKPVYSAPTKASVNNEDPLPLKPQTDTGVTSSRTAAESNKNSKSHPTSMKPEDESEEVATWNSYHSENETTPTSSTSHHSSTINHLTSKTLYAPAVSNQSRHRGLFEEENLVVDDFLSSVEAKTEAPNSIQQVVPPSRNVASSSATKPAVPIGWD